jgi:hypothetical protein
MFIQQKIIMCSDRAMLIQGQLFLEIGVGLFQGVEDGGEGFEGGVVRQDALDDWLDWVAEGVGSDLAY